MPSLLSEDVAWFRSQFKQETEFPCEAPPGQYKDAGNDPKDRERLSLAWEKSHQSKENLIYAGTKIKF